MADPLDVLLLGFGDVGQALARQLGNRASLRLVAACDTSGTLVDEAGLDPASLVEAKQAHGELAAARAGESSGWTAREAALHVDADVAVQVTPSNLDNPADSAAAIEAALASGKHVATAAKDALACEPETVRQAARRSGRRWKANASVGASVPVLETLATGFAGDHVNGIRALLNGSTTFLLSRMEQGTSREQALAQARERGLLETDPTADLTGQDAAAKAAILHQHAFGSTLSIDEVGVTGIGAVDEEACRSARKEGFAIRLLASIDEEGARVAPVQIPSESPFAIDGPSCSVEFDVEGAGSVVLSGPGAGPWETASAVLGDVVELGGARVKAAVTG